MLELEYSSRFNKDIKRMKKSGRKPQKLWQIVELLRGHKSLPAKCRPHLLKGNWQGFSECHIEPD